MSKYQEKDATKATTIPDPIPTDGRCIFTLRSEPEVYLVLVSAYLNKRECNFDKHEARFVNGYGSIGSRIAQFIADDKDITVTGIGKYSPDEKVSDALSRGFNVYVPKAG